MSGQAQTAAGDAAGDRAAGAAAWLSLAAAPTFAVMALLAGVFGGGAMAMRCPAPPVTSLLGGMAPMYLLMSAFHTPPWLRLVSRRRGRASEA